MYIAHIAAPFPVLLIDFLKNLSIIESSNNEKGPKNELKRAMNFQIAESLQNLR